MASYWKSQPRKFCDVCKCWLADNKASIDFHERGKSHIEKKEKQIAELRKRSQREYKNQQKAGKYLQQMEEAALKKYQEDLRAQGLELPEPTVEPAPEVQKYGRRNHYGWVNSYPNPNPTFNPKTSKIKPPQTPKITWTEQISPEGHKYYWDSATGKSQWEKPESYIPLKVIPPPPPDEDKVGSETGVKHGASGDSNENPAAKRTKFSAYGSWSVVHKEKPKKQIDLQLPKKVSNAVNEGLIDRTALEQEQSEPVVPKFKEKVVGSLGGGSDIVSFKKKGSKQRSIRKRLEE